MHVGSPSEPLNISVDTRSFSQLTISWNSPLDIGYPYLSHYELGFNNVTYCLNNSTNSYIFTEPFQSLSHNLTLSVVSVFGGHEFKSSQHVIRVNIFSKWIILVFL